MKEQHIKTIKMFASALVVGITSMILYTRGDVHNIMKFKKQQENIVTVLFENKVEDSFLKIRKYFEDQNPQYRVLLESSVSQEYVSKIVSGDYYDKRYLELIDKGSNKVVSSCVVVYSSSKKDGGKKFLNFLLSGEGSKILKASGYFAREEGRNAF